jgi:hypothetical protein
MILDYHLIHPLGDDEKDEQMSINLMCLMAVDQEVFLAEKLDKKRQILPTSYNPSNPA